MCESDSYREFVRRSAAELLALPENTISLLSGLGYLQLGPHLYQKVRQGQERFGLPCDQVNDDLLAAYVLQARTLTGWLHFWVFRTLKSLWLRLKLLFVAVIAIPLTTTRTRGRPVTAPAAIPRLPPQSPSRAAARPQAAIVVLSFNRLAYLRDTIEAFLATVGDSPYELIVVDNGSQDGSVEFLKTEQQRGSISKLVLLRENQGISAGYNHGFAVADERSEYVMKLDSDIRILSKDWLRQATDFLSANPQVGFVALNQLNHPVLRVLPPRWVGGTEVMDFGAWPCGSAMLVPKRVQREVGCFVEDPQMKYVPDDIDYFARVCRKGYQVLFLRQLVAFHQGHLDWSQYRSYNRGKPVRQSVQLALQLARDYDRGVRPLELRYEKYAKLSMPEDGLLSV